VIVLRLEDLAACGAHQQGHFRLSSGLHSGDYMQCARFLARPSRAEAAGRQLAETLTAADIRPEIVIGPALGGIVIAHEVARALSTPSIFTERSQGTMALRRGFALAAGQGVVIVEDVVTTGRSTREVVSIVEEEGARVLAVGSIVNRAGRPGPFDAIPFYPLLDVDFETWQANDCPLCARGVPITRPGSRPVD
jgi:orotate phosphoribosyltransferase